MVMLFVYFGCQNKKKHTHKMMTEKKTTRKYKNKNQIKKINIP